MGTNYYVVPNRPSTRGAVAHIGKSSYGWLFLFHAENNVWNDDPIVWNSYEEVMEWLEDNTTGVLFPKYCIIDEYEQTMDFRQFKQMVDEMQEDSNRLKNPNNFKHCKNVNGYRFDDGEFS